MTQNYFSASDCGIHNDYRVGIGKNARKRKKAHNRAQSQSRKSNRKK